MGLFAGHFAVDRGLRRRRTLRSPRPSGFVFAAGIRPWPRTCPKLTAAVSTIRLRNASSPWTATIGPKTRAAIQATLGSRKIVEQSYRSWLGVISLAKRAGGMGRLEDTCGRAFEATPSPPSCTLIKKLWAGWEPGDPAPAAALDDAGFLRGSS